MPDALIGDSGFVGSSLLRQRGFDACFRSHNIDAIAGARFDSVVCAGVAAQKWIANRDPAGDWQRIERLLRPLESLRCGRFVLISTVDVFADPIGVDEDARVDAAGLEPYGLHRRRVEQFVSERFPNHLIVRLPGLVGPGLRKNALFDLRHEHQLAAIDSRGVFQFYPMVNLAADLRVALRAELRTLHLCAEPISIEEVAREGFGREFVQHREGRVAHYDFRTRHAALFGGAGPYQYAKREVLLAIRAYAQSEPARAGAAAPR